jgi:hypothetical protein
MQETGALSPLALYYVAEATQQGTFDVLYSDEDSRDAERRRIRPVFKPDWSPDLLTCCPYIGHLLSIRRERFLQSGGFSSDCGTAHLLDLVLRLADGSVTFQGCCTTAFHPRPLRRRRMARRERLRTRS